MLFWQLVSAMITDESLIGKMVTVEFEYGKDGISHIGFNFEHISEVTKEPIYEIIQNFKVDFHYVEKDCVYIRLSFASPYDEDRQRELTLIDSILYSRTIEEQEEEQEYEYDGPSLG